MRANKNRRYDKEAVPDDTRFVDISGQIFGRLRVVRYAGRKGRSHYWRCLCDCESVVDVIRGNLTRGITQSCGCLHSDISSGVIVHGEAQKTPEYRAWVSMKSRCSNPNVEHYARYGGRGISVCQEWKDSFEHFLADVGRRPSDLHSIDRYPNNDGNYEPGNVRWATAKQQANNRSVKSPKSSKRVTP